MVRSKDGAEPTILSMLHGQKVVGEMYVRRLPISDVPIEDETATAQYLHQLYQHKDMLLDSYCNTGSFTKENDMPR